MRDVRLGGEHARIRPDVKMCEGEYADQTDETRTATHAAVLLVAQTGCKHNDAYWRHVGLCNIHTSTTNTNPMINAVLIDLGNVTEIKKERKG